MFKRSVLSLTFVSLLSITNAGFASHGWDMEKFTGCIADTNDQNQKCKKLCENSHSSFGGHAMQKNPKLCPDTATPIACSCDVKKSAPSEEKEVK